MKGPFETINGIYLFLFSAEILPGSNLQKTANHDSRALAECLEKRGLKNIHILSREQQELRALFRLRVSKSRDLTRAINKLKGFPFYFGLKFPESWNHAYISKRALSWLESLQLTTQAGSLTLKEYLQDVLYRRERLLTITRQLRSQVQSHYSRQYELLLSVPGIVLS